MISTKIPGYLIQIVISIAATSAFAVLPDQNFEQSALSLHNQLRANHEAAPLVWDDQLASFAKKYASHCEFKHSYAGHGENIAAGYPSTKAAIRAWYAEGEQYSYFWPHYSKSTGHFTQVVWRGTRKLGCGYAVCDGRNGTPGTFLVCEYSPAGNITNAGYFRANVLPLRRATT